MDSLTVNVVTPNGLVYDHHAKNRCGENNRW